MVHITTSSRSAHRCRSRQKTRKSYLQLWTLLSWNEFHTKAQRETEGTKFFLVPLFFSLCLCVKQLYSRLRMNESEWPLVVQPPFEYAIGRSTAVISSSFQTADDTCSQCSRDRKS